MQLKSKARLKMSCYTIYRAETVLKYKFSINNIKLEDSNYNIIIYLLTMYNVRVNFIVKLII